MSIDSHKIDRDDPRITAYALGELEGDERAAFKALLDEDPAARREVEELQALGTRLEDELRTPDTSGLDAGRRAALTAASRAPVARPSRWRVLHLATAACLLIGVVVGATVLTPSVEEKSRNPEPPSLSARAGGDPSSASVLPRRDSDGRSTVDEWAEAFPPATPSSPGQAPVAGDEEAPPPAGSKRRKGSTGITGAPATTTGAHAPGGIGVAGGGTGPIVVGGRVVPAEEGESTFEGRRGSGAPPAGLREPVDPTPPVVSLPAPSPDPAGGVVLRLPANKPVRPGLYGATRYTGEAYTHPGSDPFHRVTKRQGHTSTFSIDVDTASYANVRRMLRSGRLPPAAAVRIEELVNYFDYGYAAPEAGSEAPLRTHVQIATCPWNPKHRLARIAIKGREVEAQGRPAANLVFLVDVSGSMQDEDKLPLVKAGLARLAETIRDDDRVAIVTYSATARVALASTPGSEREALLASIGALRAGGATNGAGGIQLAYAEAQKGFVKGGVNRVILCTDGDFNVGVSDTGGLVSLIKTKAQTGVYLSVLGYGTGNFKDGKMEALSNKGNGNYAYIDSQAESERVLVEERQGTLVTIAKDVKFQLWFNPRTVAGWRLLGYENRRLAARDFNDDSKDAGEVGAGHEVTALYEIIPTGAGVPGTVDPNPFVSGGKKAAPTDSGPEPDKQALFIWRLRWKSPEGGASRLVERNVFDRGLTFEQAGRDFQWASAVGAFGMLLRHSPHRGQAGWDLVHELAAPAKGEDPQGRRAEFLGLVKKAQQLRGGR